MARVRSANTRPERIIRSLLHRLGYRFRLHAKELPGSPDIVLRPRRKAIFVHGCFWHQHGDPACRLARKPKTRLDFWLPKLNANSERDKVSLSKLDALGWKTLIVWECELRHMEQLENRLVAFLESDG